MEGAVNQISAEIFDRQSKKLKEQIELKVKALDKLPSKKSNHDKAIKYLFKIAENPSKLYVSLDYNQKRQFQNMLFPNGIEYNYKTGIIEPVMQVVCLCLHVQFQKLIVM